MTHCLLRIKVHSGHRHMLCHPPFCFQIAWGKVQQSLSLFNQYQLSHAALHSSEAFKMCKQCFSSLPALCPFSLCLQLNHVVHSSFWCSCAFSVSAEVPHLLPPVSNSLKCCMELHQMYHCTVFWLVWNAAWMLHHLFLHLTMWRWAPSQALWTATRWAIENGCSLIYSKLFGVQAVVLPLAAAEPTHSQQHTYFKNK